MGSQPPNLDAQHSGNARQIENALLVRRRKNSNPDGLDSRVRDWRAALRINHDGRHRRPPFLGDARLRSHRKKAAEKSDQNRIGYVHIGISEG